MPVHAIFLPNAPTEKRSLFLVAERIAPSINPVPESTKNDLVRGKHQLLEFIEIL
ncbi:MAG: hypothetical protein IPH33_17285 [Bacteroidetes bacterium]|nr:hypothetical protein [Bacteroidota bacterium]